MNEELFESELEDILNMLDIFSEVEENAVFVDRVESFKEAGILTTNKGLVVKLSDKSEFQLIIAKTKNKDA